jgi:hypothetical protein
VTLFERAAGDRMLYFRSRVDSITSSDATASDRGKQLEKRARLFKGPLESVFVIH